MNQIKELTRILFVTLLPAVYKNRLYRFIEDIKWNNLPAEEGELLLMKYFIDKNSVFFDIGANTGIYTYQAGKLLAPDKVYAFEPIPELYYRLKKMFKRSNIFRIAFSDETNEKQFKIPSVKGLELKSRGTLNIDYRETDETRSRIIKVKSTTIDEFVYEKKISNIGFIKIDVEGHELKVIEGGLKTLREQLPVMQIEIEQRHYKTDIKEVIAFIVNIGYACYYLDIDSKSIMLLTEEPGKLQEDQNFKTSRYINNFIFIPKTDEWETKIMEINRMIKQV